VRPSTRSRGAWLRGDAKSISDDFWFLNVKLSGVARLESRAPREEPTPRPGGGARTPIAHRTQLSVPLQAAPSRLRAVPLQAAPRPRPDSGCQQQRASDVTSSPSPSANGLG
jgi:hypothetical protein